MSNIYTEATLQEWWDEGVQTGDITFQTEGNKRVTTIAQHPLLRGQEQHISFRSGLRVDIAELENFQTWAGDYQNDAAEPPCMTLDFRVAGQMREQIFGLKEDAHEQPGASYVFFDGVGGREIEEFIVGWNRDIRIRVEPHLLRSLSVGQEASLPDEMKPFLDRDDAPLFYRAMGKMTPAMRLALQQFLNCPFHGVMERMYQESKLLELMTLQFAQLAESRSLSRQSIRFKSDDIERLHHAKEFLLQNLVNPPSMLDLARQVGLNDYKLKRGFRQVFGTTAFSYLRNHRLEQARKLLEMGIYSVEEVARMVGYRNLGAFSEAFHKHFGIRARDCMKRGSLKTWIQDQTT